MVCHPHARVRHAWVRHPRLCETLLVMRVVRVVVVLLLHARHALQALQADPWVVAFHHAAGPLTHNDAVHAARLLRHAAVGPRVALPHTRLPGIPARGGGGGGVCRTASHRQTRRGLRYKVDKP